MSECVTANEQTNDSTPFSKREAAIYLGISIRKLEYAMADRLIAYEKIGKKVVFRRSGLENFRAGTVVRGKTGTAAAIRMPNPVTTKPISVLWPKTISAAEAETLIRELQQKAREERRLSHQGAKTILVALGGNTESKAEETLAKYEADAVTASQSFPTLFGHSAVNTMDWSFAVAPVFIDMALKIESWALAGKDSGQEILIAGPFDPMAPWPERMIGCLRLIPEDEFSEAIAQVMEYFSLERRVAQRLAALAQKNETTTSSLRQYVERYSPSFNEATHYACDWVPFDALLERSCRGDKTTTARRMFPPA